MAYNFISSDRDQMYLLPPDMRDWLPGNHLVWFIMEIVSHLDLTPFYQHYNPKKEGRAAYNPSIMTALYFYSYCTGVRSSRKIEQLCNKSVPFRIISGDHHPDYTTISRFRKSLATELAGLFIQVLTICYESGFCNVSAVSVDGTKIKANITNPDSRIMKTSKAQRDGKIIPLPLITVSTMEYKLLTPEGRKLYKKRSATIEPVFGHIKEVLGFSRFMRRGLEACNCEWKMICSAYNLLKLWWYKIDKVHKKIRENLAIVPSEKQVTYALAV